MQSSPSPNLANLNQLFVQYDSDQDAKVNSEQIESIFNELGFNDVYSGTIRKVIRLLNQNSPLEDQTIDFVQLKQFAEAFITKGGFKVWKAKLGYEELIKKTIKDLYQEEDDNNASPGAGPGSAPSANNQPNPTNSHQEGEISFNVGDPSNFDQYIHFSLQKQKGQQSIVLYQQPLVKPFIKISVEKSTNEEALKIQKSFKEIYDTVIEILKSQEEDLMSEISSVSFITNVNNNVFSLFITTSNQGLIELVEVMADFFDSIVRHGINGKIDFDFRFNFDFQKFISDPNYNFYDVFVKNCSVHLKWNVWEIFHNLRKLALKADLFSDLSYDPTEPFSLFLMGLLHCSKFVGRLQFDNTSSDNQEVHSKDEIKKFLSVIHDMLTETGNDSNLALVQMAQQIDGKITIEAGLRDWRLNLQTKFNNLSKLLTADIEVKKPTEDQDEEIPQFDEYSKKMLILQNNINLSDGGIIQSLPQSGAHTTQQQQNSVELDHLSEASSGSNNSNPPQQ